MNGTVKFFNSAKGFGFIEPDEGGKDIFVHASALEAAGIRALNEGDRVSFVLEDDRRGRGKQAAQLKKIRLERQFGDGREAIRRVHALLASAVSAVGVYP